MERTSFLGKTVFRTFIILTPGGLCLCKNWQFANIATTDGIHRQNIYFHDCPLNYRRYNLQANKTLLCCYIFYSWHSPKLQLQLGLTSTSFFAKICQLQLEFICTISTPAIFQHNAIDRICQQIKNLSMTLHM